MAADLDDFFKHRSSRLTHNLIVLLDRRDPPVTMLELFTALTEEDAPVTKDDIKQD